MEKIKLHLINWLLNLSSVKRVVYTRLFKQATDDVLETMRDDTEERAEQLAAEKLNALLAPANLHNIVTFNSETGQIYIGGELADDGVLGNLKSEAEFFLASNLWGLLNDTPRELAQRSMFVSGESLDDMKKGRSILYTLDTQRKIVDKLISYNHKKA